MRDNQIISETMGMRSSEVLNHLVVWAAGELSHGVAGSPNSGDDGESSTGAIGV